MPSDLVARLRRTAAHCTCGYGGPNLQLHASGCRYRVCTEAADRIEALEREVERLNAEKHYADRGGSFDQFCGTCFRIPCVCTSDATSDNKTS